MLEISKKLSMSDFLISEINLLRNSLEFDLILGLRFSAYALNISSGSRCYISASSLIKALCDRVSYFRVSFVSILSISSLRSLASKLLLERFSSISYSCSHIFFSFFIIRWLVHLKFDNRNFFTLLAFLTSLSTLNWYSIGVCNPENLIS
jgi:hypothetical protein